MERAKVLNSQLTMRAAVHHEYGPPAEVLAVEQVTRPVAGKRDVVVKVHAAGVNWADHSMTIGKPYVMRLGYGLRAPRRGVRGLDVAGTVAEVGAGVEGFDVGDEVLGAAAGAFAEYVTAKPSQLVIKPPTITFEEAAAVPLAGCVALQALRDVGGVESGHEVLVIGASGGIGSFAVQIAKSLGARVTGVCSTPNLEFVRWLGADEVIDYTTDDYTTRTGTYDLILDMADAHSLADRRRMLTRGGTLIPNSGEGGDWFGSVGRIFKAWLTSPFVPGRLRPFLSMTKKEDLLTLAQLIRKGSVVPAVGETHPLGDAGQAIMRAGSGHAKGKVVVVIEP